jgi:tetratricopeptide (TPR) repeat protein
MAKVKKDSKKLRYLNIKGEIKPWFENKIVRIRKVTKPVAARASKWGAPSGVALIILITLTSFFLPKNEFQLIKEKLLKFPNDFEAHLQLAEKFLASNQLEEAERALLLAQTISNPKLVISNLENSVLGEKTNLKLDELWQRKHYSDPKDIRRLISAWEKIVQEKPNYRDGWLQLAILHYKLYENEKARQYLQKALELDPNFEPAKELEKIFK